MQLHQLQPNTTRQKAKRIGRGGKRGKTSGRGGKGQTARSGNSTRPELRDMIKRLPKLRGHGKNRARTVNEERVRAYPVNLAALEAAYAAGEEVTPATLLAKKLVPARAGRAAVVKILGTGSITKKVTVAGCAVSKSARAAIESAGGTVS